MVAAVDAHPDQSLAELSWVVVVAAVTNEMKSTDQPVDNILQKTRKKEKITLIMEINKLDP